MAPHAKLPVIQDPSPSRAPARIVASAPSTYSCFTSELRMLPGLRIPLRAMYVQAAGHGLLISPVGTPQEEVVVTQRPVTLVAPSLWHHLHLRPAIARYQADAVWGPPGLADKRPDLGEVRVLGRDHWPFAATLDFVVIEGAPYRNEVVLFHRASRTIYTADLVFNLHRMKGLVAPVATRLLGIHDRFAVSRLWRAWVSDAVAFRRSIDHVMTWDFERIVMAHGEVVAQGGPALLERALRAQGLYR